LKPFIASHLKDMNRRTVYSLVASSGEISKAEINRKTGISPPTVIKIIDFFLKSGIVKEAGEGDSMLGRKPQLLRFNPNAAYSIGVEYDGDILRAGLVDLLGHVKAVRSIAAGRDIDAILDRMLEACVHALVGDSGVPMSKIMGIGIGFPGVVNSESCEVLYAPLVGILDHRDYSAEIRRLSQRLGVPIFLENDVNAATVGEFHSSGLGAEDDMLYISLGVGLAAGIVLDGALRKGRTSSAGEIGYMVFDKDFITMKSKPGWMESHIVLDPLYLQVIGHGSGAAGRGNVDPDRYDSMMESIADLLALSIANLSVSLDAELVVLGGAAMKTIGREVQARIDEKLSRLCLNPVKCRLGKCDHPFIVGSAAIAREAVMDSLLVG